MESGTCCSRPILTHHTFCTVAFTVFFGRVIVCCAMVQAKCLHLIVSLFLNSLTMGTAAEVVASDILVGAQPRIRCWARTRSSSSELVDTATARRQQRVEDATRVGLQFPFRQERRGRGAPSVAMKWRDAVKAAIMHGPLPPDVTLDAPHWWQPGMPLLPPADYMAPVPLKRKRDTSAEPKTDPVKRTYMRIPDEAKLWFKDFHAYQARVHGKTLAYNIRRAKHLVPELFGPVAPDTFRRWHEGGAPDHRGRPPVDLPPFALSRLANLTHAVAARLSLSVPTWQHVYRRVLRELDIEFEPKRVGRGSFFRACSSHGNSRRLAPATGRARLTLQESVNFCSCASSTCAIASKSHRIASGTWTRQLCAWFQQASVDGPKKPSQPVSSPRAPSSRSRSRRT